MRMKIFRADFIIASAKYYSVQMSEEASGCWMGRMIERPVPSFSLALMHNLVTL